MLACPHCKRHVITARDMLSVSFDGATKCRACGKLARLDLMSRWMLSIVLAIILPMVLLYGNVFYSGHLFVVSIAVIVGAWRGLSALGLPILNLELVPRAKCLDHRQSITTFGVIIVAALVMDGFMAYRIDVDEARESTRSADAVAKPR